MRGKRIAFAKDLCGDFAFFDFGIRGDLRDDGERGMIGGVIDKGDGGVGDVNVVEGGIGLGGGRHVQVVV